jgi:hypothetical protein
VYFLTKISDKPALAASSIVPPSQNSMNIMISSWKGKQNGLLLANHFSAVACLVLTWPNLYKILQNMQVCFYKSQKWQEITAQHLIFLWITDQGERNCEKCKTDKKRKGIGVIFFICKLPPEDMQIR